MSWDDLKRTILFKNKTDPDQKLLHSQGTSRCPNADKAATL